MKNLFTIFLAIAFSIGNAHAALVGAIYPENNKDEDNVIRLIAEIRTLYMTTVGFLNLDGREMDRLFVFNRLNKEELKEFESKFKITTKNNDRVAVVKYKVKNCDNLRYVKTKLVKLTLMTNGETVSCQNNEFIAELNN